MSARQALASAMAAGLRLEAEGGKLIVECKGEPPAAVIADLKRHKPEILSLLRPIEPSKPSKVHSTASKLAAALATKEAELASRGFGPDGTTPLAEYQHLAAEGAKAWYVVPPLSLPRPKVPDATTGGPWTEPAITKDPHFGVDKVPSRYEPSWRQLLATCPSWATEQQCTAAIFGCRDLFGEWGAELLRLDWRAEDIFDRWRGLAWFLKGTSVMAIGPCHAFLHDGRIFERRRR
jgi:hypothetical protein